MPVSSRALVAAVALACVCLTLTPVAGIPLSVVLFPYIPDAGGDNFAGLKLDLAARFHAVRPDVDLTIRMEAADNLYDMGTLETLLGSGGGRADVVEVDTLLLAALAAGGLVQPVPAVPGQPLPAALDAVMVNGDACGVPTYICSNVVYSYGDVTAVSNGQDLVHALTGQDPSKRALAGNFAGSWTLPGSYIDAWADTHTNAADAVAGALAGDLDDPTMATLQAVVDSCQQGGTNPCMDGGFRDNTAAEEAFAAGAANGFVGYSERLFYVKEHAPDKTPYAISAPLGAGKRPVMFVDALVFNTHMEGAVQDAASAFAEFMASAATREMLSLSHDAPAGKPFRYLMQASQAFWDLPAVADDKVFAALRAEVAEQAVALPNSGFPENKDRLNGLLKARLGNALAHEDL